VHRVSPYLLLGLCVLFWSGNVITARAVRGDVPPLALSFWRWAIAFAVVLPFVACELRTRWREVLAGWRSIVPAGILGMGAYSTLVYLGLQWTTATNTALINATVPVLISALTALIGRQRLSGVQWLGVALSLAGVLAIVLRGDFGALAGLAVNVGDLWVLAAVAGFVVFTVCFRWRASGLSPLLYLEASIAVAVLAVAPAYAWELASGRSISLGVASAAGIAYIALLPSILSYLFWSRGVEAIGPARAGVFLYLVPVFTTGAAIVCRGERLAAFHLAGIALIVAGIWLTTSRRFGA